MIASYYSETITQLIKQRYEKVFINDRNDLHGWTLHRFCRQ